MYRTGHFDTDMDGLAEFFNSSLPVDKRLFREDIRASVAHAKMLGERGIIPQEDALAITRGLDSILLDIESGRLEIRDAEDIHMFVEAELVKRIGDAGKKLHTARSRNDQVATDFKLYVRNSCDGTLRSIRSLIDVMLDIASKNTDSVMPGFTHLQKAQPITAAHHMTAYAEMLFRDLTRFVDCKKRMNVLPLGSLALAGTTYTIDREYVRRALDFDSVSNNSLDGVSDRDFVLEYLYAASNTMLHLSRLCEELIIFSSQDFGYIKIGEAYSTGSSIMPQKRNPDIAELVRGKTGRVYGALTAMLTILKALPLAYNKDMQEDKELFFDADDTQKYSLAVVKGMLSTITYDKKRMLEACNDGYLNATDAADYLTAKGVAFRTAYEIAGSLVAYATSKRLPLNALSLAEFNSHIPKNQAITFENDIYQKIDIKNIVNARNSVGGPAPSAVKASIKDLKKRLRRLP